MKFDYLFLGVCITFFNQNEFVTGKPMIGRNVKRVAAGDFSYIVSLMRIEPGHPHSGGRHFCTGVLVTRKDILTAAHCLQYHELDAIQLLIDTIDLREGRVLYPFWWQTYDYYAAKNNITSNFHINDIASLRTLQSARDDLLPVRLSRLSNSDLYNAEVQVAGWGLNNQDVLPEVMEYANLQIIENRVCEQKIERAEAIYSPIDDRLLCSYVTPYVLLHSGDSGGPLIFRNRLVGINHGISPVNPNVILEEKINLHISVDSYRTFIQCMKAIP